ncbi:hypothetical protein AAFN46_11215 [Pseudomonas sp. CAU 1711]|uniref:methyltransferase family protein n=1 Tax=Pseudomonas sp. CAU 1711 TaxID=3140356 RepID=UPI0032619CE1
MSLDLWLNQEQLLSMQRALLLLMPCVATVLLWLMRPPTARVATGLMVAFLWNLPALLILNVLAMELGWWRFAPGASQLLGVPIDVWIGWALWWGPVAVMLVRLMGLWPVLAGMVAVDLVSMPLLEPLVLLGPNWQVGEPVAIGLSLLPSLAFAHWTASDRHPLLRTGLHILGWGGYVLWVLPACALAWEGRSLLVLSREPLTLLQWCLVPVMLLCLLAGMAAALEFARAGDGTPIPYDPPKRVVTSGPYAYVANTMQLTSAVLMLCWAAFAQSLALLAIAASFVVFDVLFASVYNRVHIAHAFPLQWDRYRRHVHEWRINWRPYRTEQPAHLYVSNLTPCLELYLAWLARRRPSNLLMIERSACGPDVLLRYEAPGLPCAEYGASAMARALEHTHLGYAMLAWLIRFPLLAQVMDRLLHRALRLHYGLSLAQA